MVFFQVTFFLYVKELTLHELHEYYISTIHLCA